MRSMNRSYDAIVVGARCAGAATAMLLARRGLRVLAIDRGGYGADTLSTHALMRGGVMQLHRWGVLPRVVAEGTPPVRRTAFHYADEVVDVAIKPLHGVDALYAPRRTVLDRLLVDAAWEAGADVRHHHALIALDRGTDGRVRGAAILDADGRRVEVAAGLVVGADGIGSSVARLVQAPVEREARHAAAAIYGYVAGLEPGGYRWFYRPGVSAGIIPTNDGRACVFSLMPAARFRDEARHDPAAAFRRVFAESAPDWADALDRARLDGRLMAFAGRRGFLRRPAGPGWALVGDAAHFKDPITAHGITDALRDAELLADAAARGTDDAFRDYARTRDALALPVFEATDAIASFAWDLDALKAHHQAMNTAMKREVEHLAARPPLAAREPVAGLC